MSPSLAVARLRSGAADRAGNDYNPRMTTPSVTVKKGRVQPIAFRHPWLFAGSIERVEGEPAAGDVVDVLDPGGRFLGRGFFSPSSTIRVRLFAFERDAQADQTFFERRLEAAARFRRDVIGLPAPRRTDAFRLVHSEADGLPGLVVEAYGDVLVVQLSHVALERRRDVLLAAIERVFGDRPVYERDDPHVRKLEGLPPVQGWIRGRGADTIDVRENGHLFRVDLAAGQKTGFFCDQRDNRAMAAGLAAGRRTLDAFCYTGAFAMNLARPGEARSVVAIESSARAIERARENAAANEIEGIEFLEVDAYKFLGALGSGDRFDLVVLDPPAYAPNRGAKKKALQKYLELNRLALSALEPGGILVTCSCSGAVTEEEFEGVLRGAAVRAERRVRVFWRGGQAPDHPVDPACPEGRYLKALFCQAE